MSALPVIAIFDVGKTNKKLFLFDENYKIVFERTAQLLEITDEDGDSCENVESLAQWENELFNQLIQLKEFTIKALNFSAYGASFVHVDEKGKPLTPLYNYLKPYPDELKKNFYSKYGGEEKFSVTAASPVLGSLNSGMQLYRLKYQHPDIFNKVSFSLHLPQYLSYLMSGKACSDITSIGCHTNLWDFSKNQYHEWLYAEKIIEKLSPIVQPDDITIKEFSDKKYLVGPGLHDSSAALIPYLSGFSDPFILISTGTWCISLNPFNHQPLTAEELKKDCLCYMTYQGTPVKASRLFAGHEHEEQVKKLAEHFHKALDYYNSVAYTPDIVKSLRKEGPQDLSTFRTYEEAYHQLMLDIIKQQTISTKLIVQNSGVKNIFVDGGFGHNSVYMNLLANAFPEMKVYSASIPQASALGGALLLHKHWNTKPLPQNLIKLQSYWA